MKPLTLFVSTLGLFLFCHAQNGGTPFIKDQLKVTVSDEQLTLLFQNRSFTPGSPQALDSCLKRIVPRLSHPSFVVESVEGTDRERMRQVAVVLESYHCPIAGIMKRNPPPSPLKRRADTSGH